MDELINGVLRPQEKESITHAYLTQEAGSYLRLILRGCAKVRERKPITLSEIDEPVPDLCVCTNERYKDRHPSSKDIYIVIEYASPESLDHDLLTKAHLYGTSGINNYWLVDYEEGKVTVMNTPSASPISLSNRLIPMINIIEEMKNGSIWYIEREDGNHSFFLIIREVDEKSRDVLSAIYKEGVGYQIFASFITLESLQLYKYLPATQDQEKKIGPLFYKEIVAAWKETSRRAKTLETIEARLFNYVYP